MMKADPWIDSCRRRLDFGEFLRVAAEWLAAWLCVFGSLVLVVKLLAPSLWPHVLWIGGLTIPLMVLAWRRSQLRPHTRSEGAILLDRKLQTGGLLLALADAPNANWERELTADRGQWEESLPRIRPTRFARLVLLPAVFAIGACFAPLREAKTEPPTPSGPGLSAVEELPAMFNDLKNADALSADEEAHIQIEIAKLLDETKNSPLTHEKWERIDTLRIRMQNRLDERFRAVRTAQQAARRLADAKKNGDKSLTPEQKRQLEADVTRALKDVKELKQPSRRLPAPGKTAVRKTVAGKTAPQNIKPNQTPPKKSLGQKTNPAKTAKTKTGASPKNSTTTKSKSPKTSNSKSPAPGKTRGANSPQGKTPGRKTPDAKTPKGDTPKGKTAKGETPKGKTPKGKTAKGETPKGKTPKGKTPKGKTPKGKSPKVKTGGAKTRVAKSGAGKTRIAKTAGVKKPPSGKSIPKGAKSPAAKQASKKKSAGTTMPKLPKTLPDISPEMISQLAKMMQQGKFRLPDDPELRAQLLKQAQKLLAREGHKLAELQKRYGRQIAEAFRNQRLGSMPPFNSRPAPGKRNGRAPKGSGGNKKQTPSSGTRSKVSFRDVVLPPGFLDMKKAEVVRVTGRAPKVKSSKPTVDGKTPFAGTDSGGETYKRRHRNRHRATVKRYFRTQK